ncbi:hypothetical protein LTR56_008342 [Elasticomyces elasticus]|nr:hypothetical protein LTR56_008342 [Elasticomyces elasticus]KAK3661478.1 hypothetical protein LTR22_007488 [Elasticomyces elasticus]KAK4926164.1 hypothetical protein LTR49_006868 [Elasticomyces elasticus]KAK5756899.1 hypothetical protein LTS12_012978 [Elasticomyces elasticus]
MSQSVPTKQDQPDADDHRLCDRCSVIFSDGSLDLKWTTDPYDGRRSKTDEFIHHSSLESFERALSAKCFICTTLGQQPEWEDISKTSWRFEQFNGALELEFVPHHRTEGPGEFNHYFDLVDVTASRETLNCAQSSLRESSTGNTGVLELAKHWLSLCTHDHATCANETHANWYPTRLLDVSGSVVRLVHSTELDPNAYATLSHCWGHKPFFVLTSGNYVRLQRGVPVDEFPRTFQDAFHVTRQLGLQYVWIDSYCIIQASPRSKQDWLVESARMKDVYANAFINISAAYANDPHDGLFRRRGGLEEQFCIDWRSAESDDEKYYHVVPRHYNTGEKHMEFFDTHNIFKRGWIFQERLMCNRMLHFGEQQIYWECSENGHLLASEEFPEGEGVLSNQESLYPWALDLANIEAGGFEESWLQLWGSLVNHYSNLELTYAQNDKLVALGGVAQRMADILQDDYVAGMFGKTLVAQLPWQKAQQRTKRAEEWRAPSWSWASMDGGVLASRPFGYGVVDVATVAEINLELADTSNPFGALRPGSITLHCRALDVVVGVDRGGGEETFNLTTGDVEINWEPDGEDEIVSLPSTPVLVLTQMKCCYVNPAHILQTRSLTLAEILSLRGDIAAGKYEHSTWYGHFWGLVLQRITADRYTRLGAVRNHWHFGFQLLDLWHEAEEQHVRIY